MAFRGRSRSDDPHRSRIVLGPVEQQLQRIAFLSATWPVAIGFVGPYHPRRPSPELAGGVAANEGRTAAPIFLEADGVVAAATLGLGENAVQSRARVDHW